jgi:hypothetical protein
MLTAALWYARRGWPVFPCHGKAPLTEHGFHDATTDPDTISGWWTRTPDANVATPTGIVIDALDFDRKPGKVDAVADALPRLHRAGLLVGAIGVATTRNGGLHIVYPASGLPSGSVPSAGVDFKARGGYVVVAPSRVPSDFPDLPGEYRWTDSPFDHDGTPLDWPAVRRFLRTERPAWGRPQRPEAPGLAPLLRAVREAPEGNRNNVLFWAAARAAGEGVLDHVALLDAARVAGLDDREALTTIRSGERAGVRTP